MTSTLRTGGSAYGGACDFGRQVCRMPRQPKIVAFLYAGPGSLMRRDVKDGLRHWDLYDVEHLAPTPQRLKAAEEVRSGV